jgi:tetratricopeptide (TPR) repeat protein
VSDVQRRRFSAFGFRVELATIIFVAGLGLPVYSRALDWESQNSGLQSSTDEKQGAETDLQLAIALTRRGSFSEAIPHFLASKGHVSNEYALEFNLALCYIGTGEFERAIAALAALRAGPQEGAGVENLLAQAYAGNGQAAEAFDALQRAVAFTPKDEKLYLFVADAFVRHQENAESLRVIELGLEHLPDSARLHYERGYLLSMLDDLDGARVDFRLAMRLAARSEIGYLAEAQENFLAGNLREAVHVSRKASAEGKQDYQLLAILGEALIRGGASPGQAEFAEARAALEKSVSTRPNYASSQIALGHLELLDARVDAAIERLETGRRLSPQNPAVYALLAAAYRRSGRFAEAEAMLAILAKLNQEQAQRIRTAPGDAKAIPGASGGSAARKKPPGEE